MKIAIIGAKGIVGRTLVEYFDHLGFEVISVDKDTKMTLEKAASLADVIFVVTLPIEEVASLVAQAATFMRPRSLLIHGTSIERPVSSKIQTGEVFARGITFCHLHFHFRPEVPLSRTLFGQHITISIQGVDATKWQSWILEQLEPSQPIIDYLEPGEHDQITSVSQVVHMIVALLVARTWRAFPTSVVRKAIDIGGPPCRFLIRSVLRVGTGTKVVESILLNHPRTLNVLEQMIAALQGIRSVVLEHRPGILAGQLLEARSVVDPLVLGRFDQSTARLARAEADTRETNFEFRFSSEANVVGLLARILQEFDSRGIDKTTTIAQVDPDGGCTILVGIREMSEAAREAEKVVRSWS